MKKRTSSVMWGILLIAAAAFIVLSAFGFMHDVGVVSIIFTIVFLIATCCSCSIQTLAFNQLNEQTKVKDSDKEAIDSVDVKEYSEEYKRWLELSEKERNLELEPNPYYTSYYPLAGEKNKLNESFSLERKEFNALAVFSVSSL